LVLALFGRHLGELLGLDIGLLGGHATVIHLGLPFVLDHLELLTEVGLPLGSDLVLVGHPQGFGGVDVLQVYVTQLVHGHLHQRLHVLPEHLRILNYVRVHLA
jgi:hypothetical protein